jgi:hypothetical protein
MLNCRNKWRNNNFISDLFYFSKKMLQKVEINMCKMLHRIKKSLYLSADVQFVKYFLLQYIVFVISQTHNSV